MTKLLVKIVERILQQLTVHVTKRDVHSERFFFLNVPTSQHVLTVISNFILQKSIVSPTKKNHECKLCHQVFAGSYPLRLHSQKLNNAKNLSENNNVVVSQIVGEFDNESLKEELETCMQFLVDSERENGRLLNFAIDILDTHILS